MQILSRRDLLCFVCSVLVSLWLCLRISVFSTSLSDMSKTRTVQDLDMRAHAQMQLLKSALGFSGIACDFNSWQSAKEKALAGQGCRAHCRRELGSAL